MRWRTPTVNHSGPTHHRGAREDLAEQSVDELGELLESIELPIRVLGPAPAPVTKLRGKYRFHLLAFADDHETLRKALQRAAGESENPIILIRADGLTPHESVVKAMDAARQLGWFQITFATGVPQ